MGKQKYGQGEHSGRTTQNHNKPRYFMTGACARLYYVACLIELCGITDIKYALGPSVRLGWSQVLTI